MSRLQKCVKDQSLEPSEALELIRRMDSVTGLALVKSAAALLKETPACNGTVAVSHEGDSEAAEIDALVKERTEAKKARDFARADEIRRNLDARGVVVTDTPNGPVWKENKKLLF